MRKDKIWKRASRYSLKKARWRDRQGRGANRELTVLEILSSPDMPPWVCSARKGTPDEDRRGIDIVVATDVGKLFLQIKGSQKDADLFSAKRRKSSIATVVLRNPGVTRENRNRILAALSRERASVRKKRGDL